MLRPFFKELASPEDILEARKWTIDIESAWFPGTLRDKRPDGEFVLAPCTFVSFQRAELAIKIRVARNNTVESRCNNFQRPWYRHSSQLEFIG